MEIPITNANVLYYKDCCLLVTTGQAVIAAFTEAASSMAINLNEEKNQLRLEKSLENNVYFSP